MRLGFSDIQGAVDLQEAAAQGSLAGVASSCLLDCGLTSREHLGWNVSQNWVGLRAHCWASEPQEPEGRSNTSAM